ncbi:MerR family transcriptional regulator [Kribbella sp. NPDC050124]|uniref:MerR family transcriptional regulator n=1 Tax=Kribbella sp. NPDC050124 TaxID=3364114 RepID=UPI0037935519
MTSDELTVGQAAALVGVSVRTLHHWDTVGLIRPSGRTLAGYRVYSGDDVARIHQVLVYRELGLPLAEIGRVLDDPSADAREHLRRQRAQLTSQISHLQTMVDAVDRMLAARSSGIRLSPQEQVEIFGTDWRPEWVQEAEDRWGDTKQWAQYVERSSTLSPDDWRAVAAATEALHLDLAEAQRAGVVPGSAEANALAERHRESFARYFDCTHSMHACLARMFVSEPGYSDYFESLSPGLTDWLHATIFANTASHGVDPASATWT